ncbi:MAG: tRNA dihydrouridine synthase DusB [Bifidobacteriaceae bacterium]|jgi:nifR3 family TIM-barrel protein|nr:tRNA dihydrouridine synthase DusB [Bifidobacteriaceae bacterium]
MSGGDGIGGWPRLRLGRLEAPAPVMLAPMAGVTNLPFRLLCRSFGEGLFVTEMITSRALVEGKAATRALLRHDPSERPRSVQLYGVDPAAMAAAVRLIRRQDLADHIDLNFGCPAPKVTRQGGGAALPWKLGLFRRIVGGAVAAAGDIPVTVKLRSGIDDQHLTFIEAGLAAAGEGAAAITLHARSAAQHYSGRADWSQIALLKRTVTAVPVLGNGDIFEADDAAAMIRQTGCDGVVVGRGCLGRPWLFADLRAVFAGREGRLRPNLGFVMDVIRRHGRGLVDWCGSEERGLTQLRRHMSWYLKGYPVGGEERAAAHRLTSLADLEGLLSRLDPESPYPGPVAGQARGRAGGPKRPRLPDGWLDSAELTAAHRAALAAAEAAVSGG